MPKRIHEESQYNAGEYIAIDNWKLQYTTKQISGMLEVVERLEQHCQGLRKDKHGDMQKTGSVNPQGEALIVGIAAEIGTYVPIDESASDESAAAAASAQALADAAQTAASSQPSKRSKQ